MKGWPGLRTWRPAPVSTPLRDGRSLQAQICNSRPPTRNHGRRDWFTFHRRGGQRLKMCKSIRVARALPDPEHLIRQQPLGRPAAGDEGPLSRGAAIFSCTTLIPRLIIPIAGRTRRRHRNSTARRRRRTALPSNHLPPSHSHIPTQHHVLATHQLGARDLRRGIVRRNGKERIQ